jgi:hypothetical protein
MREYVQRLCVCVTGVFLFSGAAAGAQTLNYQLVPAGAVFDRRGGFVAYRADIYDHVRNEIRVCSVNFIQKTQQLSGNCTVSYDGLPDGDTVPAGIVPSGQHIQYAFTFWQISQKTGRTKFCLPAKLVPGEVMPFRLQCIDVTP